MLSQAGAEGMAVQWRHEMTWSEGCITADVASTAQLTHQSMQGTTASNPSVQDSNCEHHITPPSASHSGEQRSQPFSTAGIHLFPVYQVRPSHNLFFKITMPTFNLTCNGYLHFSFFLSYTSHTCLQQDFMDKYKIQIMKVYCKNAGTLLQTRDKLAPP